MRRICTTLVLVGSPFIVAAGPAQAKSDAGHRQQARAAIAQKHVTTQRANRARTSGKRVYKFTYGRT